MKNITEIRRFYGVPDIIHMYHELDEGRLIGPILEIPWYDNLLEQYKCKFLARIFTTSALCIIILILVYLFISRLRWI